MHLAASWPARVAVSVWCLAMVVFTAPVRVEFSVLVRLWWVVGSHISWSRTFWCLSSASTWLVKWSKDSFTRLMLALSRICSHCSSTAGVLFRRVQLHSSWWEFSCQGHLFSMVQLGHGGEGFSQLFQFHFHLCFYRLICPRWRSGGDGWACSGCVWIRLD